MKKRYWIAILCAILTLVLTVAAASADAGDVYGLATDASDLHNGDRIILVSDDGSYYQAMATDFSGMQVTVTDNTIIEQNGMLALTLTETDGGWLLASNDGYLAADGGALTIVPDSANAAVWSISIATDGTATISCADGSIIFAEQDGGYRFACGDGGNELAIYNATFELEQHPFGDGLWWTFVNGKLTIGGSGDMPNYAWDSHPQWSSVSDHITAVEIQNGVTSIGDYAFEGCTGLQEITIPNGVTSIGNSAFRNCTGLRSVTIPDSVTSIGHWAFSSCTRLHEITIPDSVTSIDYNAFSYCTGLESISIPDSMTSIGSQAFYGCTGLQSITIGNGVVSFGSDVFSNTAWWDAQSDGVVYFDYILVGVKGTCGQIIRVKAGTRIIANNAFFDKTQITKVTIPDSVTSIGWNAFTGCTGLTSITFPNSMTNIGDNAFRGCTGLTTITIPDSVTYINSTVFYGCTGLTSITIPGSVTSIGQQAFRGCTGLTSITIPDSVASIDDRAFYGCAGLQSITMPCSLSIGSSAFSGCTSITSVHLTKGTGIMADYDYYSCTYTPWYISRGNSLTIILDDGILNIGDYAFYNCTGLTEITIPDSVTSIGDRAFYGCAGLQSITMPCSASIGTGAFQGCTGITSVYLTKGTGTMIDYSDAYQYTPWYVARENSLTVTLDDGIQNIGNYAFCCCTGLSEITIPDSVTSIGDYAFSWCEGLTAITIPDSVTSIGYSAFYGCSGLQSVKIPDSVTSIGDYAFYGCTGLTEITIGNGVTSIDDWTFANCTGLTEISIPDSVTSIGERAFDSCTGLTEVTIPDSVTTIGNTTFIRCTGLTTITIPNSVTSIGISAFYDCTGLQSVTIGNGVTSIGDRAFYNCTGLTDVYFLGTKAQKEQIVFGNYNNPLLNATWHYISEPPAFKTQSLVLADSIGVNFFLQLPEIDGIDWSESYMTFEIFGIDGCTDRCDYDPDFTNSKGYYGFTCYINAAQLADTITATFHYGPGLKVEKTYSVKEYLGTYDEYRSIFDPKTQAMIEALADYGHYVQAFLAAQKGWTYGVEHEEMDKYYTASYDVDAIKAAAADYAIVRVNESNGDVEKITYSMAVDSATAILVYFKPAADYSGTLTVKVNGEDYTATAVNGRYEVRIPDISAHQLGRTFTIVATTEHGTATAEVSALSYVAGSLNAYASVPLTANAMASIYRYAMAAEEYKN